MGLQDEKEDDGEDEEETNNHVMDLQRNHTSRTANRSYAGTSGFQMDRMREVQFREASEGWQKFWGVSSLDYLDKTFGNMEC